MTTTALEQLMRVAESLVRSLRIAVELGAALEATHPLLENSNVAAGHACEVAQRKVQPRRAKGNQQAPGRPPGVG